MKIKTIRILASVIVGLIGLSAVAHEAGGPLTSEQKTYLSQYEGVRKALAADDLPAAKKAAAILADTPQEKPASEADVKRAATNLAAAKKLAAANSLGDARDAFKILSRKANHLAEGQAGYFRFICPMVANDEGKWVQTAKEISNPYQGKAMPKCGNALE
jgi:hypothetical protein